MALPRTGELGLRSINAELGRSTSAEISLDTAENGGYGAINTSSPSYPNSTNPAAVSEWYGYTHARVAPPACTFSAGATRVGPGSVSGTNTNTILQAYLSGITYGGTGSRGGCEAYYYINGVVVFDVLAPNGAEEGGIASGNPYPVGSRTYQITNFTANANAASEFLCGQ